MSKNSPAEKKPTRFFSGQLMKETVRSNLILALVILVIMIGMSVVINYATSIMDTDDTNELTTDERSDAQEDFFTYLSALALYDTMAQADLSYDDFASSADDSDYRTAFDFMNDQSDDFDLSISGFNAAISQLERTGVSLDTYVDEFEYAYALNQSQGVFSGNDLDLEEFMDVMFETMGLSTDFMDTMETMDFTSMLNLMYFTVIGLLPILLFVVIVANSLIAERVDRGSMAYVLSTSTKRSAVTITQAIYLIVVPLIIIAIVCCARIWSTSIFFDEVNVEMILGQYAGMYLLVEAIAAICYFGSCVFNRSNISLAFGGGLAVWFFLASLLGMFGSPTMVDMGIGVEELGMFNNLTIIGLFDIDAISTIGSSVVDTAFIWKFAVLGAIAVVFYVVGAIRFGHKDLPL